MTLAERVVALHEALDEAGVPHAFGGAIALAFATRNPRGTNDIDCNVFVPATDPEPAIAALPAAIARPDALVETIARDGQVRLWWDETPVDLFFDYNPIHVQAAAHVRRVDFDGTRLPVLGPVELVVFKVMFDRGRDWVDVEDVISAGAVDLGAVRASLEELLEPGDPRFAQLDDVERRASA